jgi:hypothetical protein
VVVDDEPMSTNMVLRGGHVLDLPLGTWRASDVRVVADGVDAVLDRPTSTGSWLCSSRTGRSCTARADHLTL